MQTMKKRLAIAVVSLTLTLFSIEAQAQRKIGVLMFSEEVRYIEALKGNKDKLRKGGFGEPKTTFIVEQAGANKARAAELVQTFVAGKPDLIITLGTSATLAVSREIQDVPIVFSVVYDPVEAGIAKGWKSSGNNTTGSSSKIPMSRLMETLQHFTRVKRLAVLYTTGEKNSESVLKDLQRIEANYKIKVIPVRLTKIEEVNQLLPEVLRTADALYVTGSNLIDSQVSLIADMATKAKVITITHLEDLAEKGVLLGVCADAYSMGQLAGEKAVKILKGGKPSSIPIELAKTSDVILNMKTVQKGQFQIPPNLMKTITRTIE
ncbi:MAG TPA: ABC transporter substrate-binding protein [Syntrophales bacterium]|nr:ABC transporter substrate-binding protein [Syntrophales bacterium]